MRFHPDEARGRLSCDPTPRGSATSAGEPRDSTTGEAASPLSAEAELQARYREEYLLQLRRLSCPGCGEDFSVY